MMIKNYFKKFNIGVLLDSLLLITLLIQDIDWLRLFNTQAYKYVIILMFFILIFDFIKNKKTFKINIPYVVILVLLYIYSFSISFSKTIIVPSVFFIIEIVTFFMYVQSKKDIKALIKIICGIFLACAVIISIFSVIQFIAFKFNIKAIYELLTQNVFYLNEGRFSSIYTEPAHLCTILCAGVFLSMFNLFVGKSKINYLYLVLTLFATIISGSIIVYIALAIFLVLAYFIAIFNKNKSVEILKKNTLIVTLVVIFVSCTSFVFFERNVIYSITNKFNSLFSKSDYNIEEKVIIEPKDKKEKKKEFDLKDTKNNTKLQNEIMYDQLSNSSAYAIKSNLYICIDKLKDKYLLGTGAFTHIVYYDKYMEKRYSNGYVRINYADAGSMFLRIFSEFGIIGLIVFIAFLIYVFVRGLRKQDYFLLFTLAIFITQSIRLGEYNWVLNCLGFIIMISSIKLPEKCYKSIGFKKKVSKNGKK